VPIEWDEGLSVGVDEIDVQHRQILRRLRGIMAAAAERRTDEVRSALRFLERYVVDHFAAEERWMAEHGYPGALEHARGHAALCQAIAAGRRAVEERGEDGAAPAARIASAIEQHMMTEDLRVGQFWTARENLRRLAESGPGAGLSLTPIPGQIRAVRPSAAAPPDDAEGERAPRAAPADPPSPRRR
jgi:hemerythrin-like metal-binding protein